MRDCASIRAKIDGQEVIFEWMSFDGDDCFKDFHIDLVKATGAERFAFGECVVWGLRRSVRFFRGQQDEVSFGFSCPEVRTYDLLRIENGFLLQIRLEANRSEELRFENPSLTFDDEFLSAYDADKD